MEDRLSSLPEDLHSILRDLPLKHAARTSALSRRWVPQWIRALADSRVLDFTDRDFARGQPPARAAATVGRCLRLHAEHGATLDALRVALVSPPGPGSGAFGRDVIGWVAAALARGAREVNVDTVAGGRRSRERRRRVPGSPRRPVPSTPCCSIHAAGTTRRARPRQRRNTHHRRISGEHRIDPIASKVIMFPALLQIIRSRFLLYCCVDEPPRFRLVRKFFTSE